MSLPPAMVSSASVVWETPQDFFDALDREFGFATGSPSHGTERAG